MTIKNIKLKNASGDYLYPYTENLPIATTEKAGVVILDDTPTESSTNALSSGGAKIALDEKLDVSGTALKATADAEGNEITVTYATKSELSLIETKANEAKSLAEGRTRASSFASYADLISALNTVSKTDYKIGDIFYIQAQSIPDLWVYSVEEASTSYTYSSDAELVNTIETYGFIQIGYFKLSALESAKVDLAGFVPVTRTVNNKSLSENIVLSAGDVVQIVSGNGKFAVKRTAVGDQLISSAETVVKGKIQCCAVIDHPVGNGRGPGFYGKLRSPGKSGRAVAGNAAVKRKIAGNIERAEIMNVVQAAVCFVAAENGVAYFQRGVRSIINRAAESFACCRSCAVAAENGVVAEGDHAFAVKRAAQCFGRVGFDTVVGKAAV